MNKILVIDPGKGWGQFVSKMYCYQKLANHLNSRIIFLTKKSFFGPAGFSTVKNSQKGPQTHLGLLPLLQQCSGNGISTATARGAPYGHFFTKFFFRPSLIFHRQEQPKRRPKPPGLASIATAVPWRQYFNCHSCGRIERN